MMAKPSVTESVYLKTLGDELHPQIIFMWTGPDIISKEISVAHIKELTSVVKRKPFIWDNVRPFELVESPSFLTQEPPPPCAVLCE